MVQDNTLIISTSGKPIYARKGDPPADLLGLIQAVVSSFAAQGETLRVVETCGRKMVFMMRRELVLLRVCKEDEPEQFVRDHLNLVYHHILSLIPRPHLTRIYAAHPNYDLRHLLTPTTTLDTLVDLYRTSVAVVWNLIEPFPLPKNVRDDIAATLLNNRSPDLWPRGWNVHPGDVLVLRLLCERLGKQVSTGAAVVPVGLPAVDEAGFVYCLIQGIRPEGDEEVEERRKGCETVLVLVSRVKDALAGMQDMANKVIPDIRALLAGHVLASPLLISADADAGSGLLADVDHYAYHSTALIQLLEDPIHNPSESTYTIYRHLSAKNHFLLPRTRLAIIDNKYALWRGQDFRLYISYTQPLDYSRAWTVARELRRLVLKRREELFILNSPSF